MIHLSPLFTSHMVFQANKPIRIFGTGEGEVRASFLGEERTAVADGDKWLVEFPSRPYGGPYTLSITLDGEEKLLEDVWLGDVYLLGGQSNMQMRLEETNFPPEQFVGNEHVRSFSATPERAGEDWVVLTRENAGRLSAIGYHIGQALANKDRKIGFLECNRGATAIQTWMPPDVVRDPRFQVANKSYVHTKYAAANVESHQYQTMLSMLTPFSMAAALWYQGESNASEGEAPIYVLMLEALITSWRRDFRDKHLPFIVVQIADCVERDTPWWRMIQREQLRAAKVIPNVKTVISRDVCENDNIHPATKHLLAARIAELLK